KGRPISLEEFERLVLAAEKITDRYRSPWQCYLRGQCASGLRLAESLELTWDRADKLQVDMQPGEHPMLRIPAALEKGNTDRLLPMAPEFAEFLQETPQTQRTGYVFKPMPQREKRSQRLGPGRVTRTVA